MRSTNPREVGLIFRSYVRKIHARSNPKDPYFIQISIACGKASVKFLFTQPHSYLSIMQIEQWNEQHYPSFVLVVSDKSGPGSKPMLNPSDPRVRILELENRLEAELSKKKRIEDVRSGVVTNGVASNGGGSGEIEALLFVAGAMVLILGATGAVVWFVLRFF